MRSILGLFPDVLFLLAIHPDELAPLLVQYFRQMPTQDRWMAGRCAMHWAAGYPPDHQPAVVRLLVDAWQCVLARGYLIAEADLGRPTYIRPRTANQDRGDAVPTSLHPLTAPLGGDHDHTVHVVAGR